MPRKAYLKLFLILLLSVSITAELLVRLLSPYGYITPEILKSKSLEYQRSIFAKSVFPQRKVDIDAIDPGDKWHINSLGYRGEEFTIEKPRGVIRIYICGGSSTFDVKASEGGDWPHLVEKNLKNKGWGNIQVINAGIPANALYDCIGRLIGEGHLFNPDYVLYYGTWNDLKHFYSDEPLLRLLSTQEIELNPLINYYNSLDKLFSETSQFYVRVRNFLLAKKLAIDQEGKIPQRPYTDHISSNAQEQFRLNLETFVDVSKNIGAVPVLTTEARLVSKNNSEEDRKRISYDIIRYNHETLLSAFEFADKIIKEVSTSKKTYLIDISGEMSGKSDFFVDHVHTSEGGSQFLANYVSDQMENILDEKSRN